MENVLLSYQNQIKNIQGSIGVNSNEVAIGINAGFSNQGSYAIAVGANAVQ